MERICIFKLIKVNCSYRNAFISIWFFFMLELGQWCQLEVIHFGYSENIKNLWKLKWIYFFSSYSHEICFVINHKTKYLLYFLKNSILESMRNLHNMIISHDLNALFSSIECELFSLIRIPFPLATRSRIRWTICSDTTRSSAD